MLNFIVVVFPAIVTCVLLLAPALVGQMITGHEFTVSQAGYVISAELGGMAFATLPAYYWVSRHNWRKFMTFALVSLGVGNVITGWVYDFETFMALRFVLGIFAGSVMVLCLNIAGSMPNKERGFALLLLGQLVVGTIGLALLPFLFNSQELSAFYWVYGAAVFMLLPFVRFFPQTSPKVTRSVEQSHSMVPSKLIGAIALTALFLFYVPVSGVWTYIERVGVGANLNPKTIGYVLSFATLMGVLGSVSAIFITRKLSEFKAMMLGYALFIFSMIILIFLTDLAGFFLGAAIFKYTWTFSVPFILAYIARIDVSGNLLASSNLIIAGGLSAGPTVAAFILHGTNQNFQYLFLIMGSLVLVSLYLISRVSLATRPLTVVN